MNHPMAKKRKKKEFEIPSVELEGGIPKMRIDADLKNQQLSPKDSGSETSDGEGGRIKRKLKIPKFGIGGGVSRKAKGSKSDDSGSETSDGEGGRIKRKLKMPKFGLSGNIKGSKPDDDSGSETSDGNGGRIKRKLKMPSVGVGGAGGGTIGLDLKQAKIQR